MTTNIIEIEGTWEQIAPQALHFPKRRMRLTILPETSAENADETVPQTQQFANAWEYLQSFPKRTHTPEEWERIEREIQEEKDSWGD